MPLVRRLRRQVRRRRARLKFHLRHRDMGLYLARFIGLCLAAALVVGFSRPVVQERVADTGTHTSPGMSARPAAGTELASEQVDNVAEQPLAMHKAAGGRPAMLSTVDPLSAKPVVPSPDTFQTASTRVGSFVQDTVIEPLLGRIRHAQWLLPATADASVPTVDMPSRHSASWRFHGVGFPEILTGVSAEQVNAVPERHWRPLITWRESPQDAQLREPIANVRCMGLSPQAVARRADRYADVILDTALESGISVSLVKAIVTRESCFDSSAVSPVGAQGLMQLMPETASWLKVDDPLDPIQNLRAGIRYIASLRDRFDDLDLALAAYNAGPGNVRRYEGIPPFAETRDYVATVRSLYRRYAAATQLASR